MLGSFLGQIFAFTFANMLFGSSIVKTNVVMMFYFTVYGEYTN